MKIATRNVFNIDKTALYSKPVSSKTFTARRWKLQRTGWHQSFKGQADFEAGDFK